MHNLKQYTTNILIQMQSDISSDLQYLEKRVHSNAVVDYTTYNILVDRLTDFLREIEKEIDARTEV